MDANSRQVGGEHYKSGFQHWDWIELINLRRLASQVTKYVTRWKKKNGLQDLGKSLHYLEKYIEVEHDRHEQVLLLTQNFVRENNITGDEKTVIDMLIRYQLGDGDRLLSAQAAIQRLMEKERRRLDDSAIEHSYTERLRGNP